MPTVEQIADTPIAGGYPYIAQHAGNPSVTAADATCAATTYDELRDCLENAGDGEIVWIPGDAEIDHTPTITGDGPIEVTADNVTLASDRGHTADSEGGLLYRDETRDYEFGIEVRGDGFYMTGVRMRGGAEYSDPPTDEDMADEPDDINMLLDGVEGATIENCEISHFRSRGLEVRDSGHSSFISVHHNHIHHNVIFGNGYGIDNVGSDMGIAYNYFDYHRHAIAGNSPADIRETIIGNVFGHFWINDEIDIHAEDGEGSFGGTAPEYFEIRHNLFVGEPSVNSGQSHIHPEAVPAELSYIEENWFTLDWDSDSPPIRQEGEVRRGAWDNIEVAHNHYGIDPQAVWDDFIAVAAPIDSGDGDTGDGSVPDHAHDEYAAAGHGHDTLSDVQTADVKVEIEDYLRNVSVNLSDGNGPDS